MSPANEGADPTAELLGFEGVSCRRPDGHRQIAVLKDASFSIECGSFAGIYGARRSGKSTLLRLAAGIELPDSGIVRIDGRDTASMSALERERLLRNEVGLVCVDDWHPKPRESVLDYVALALGSEGATLRQARHGARRALKQIGLDEGADDLAGNLCLGERLRAMLARAIVRRPRLLLVDEPAAIPRISDRDELLASLRSAAQEIGAALLIASEEMSPLRGADLMIMVGGEVNVSKPRRGTVVPFPGTRSPGGQGGSGGRASDGEARFS